MRILHVITSLDDGGAEAVLFRLVTHASSCKHCVVSLAGFGKYGALLSQAGISVYSLDMRCRPFNILSILSFIRILRGFSPDIVQTWMYHADLAGGVVSWLLGYPVVWGMHNTTLDPNSTPILTILIARICGLLSTWIPSRIITCSRASVGVHVPLGYLRHKMIVIPNGYPTSEFSPNKSARDKLRADCGISPNLPVFGMVARFSPQKDHLNFLEAISCLRNCLSDFRVFLIGPGTDICNTVLVDMIKRCNLIDSVTLLGPRRDIPSLMSAIDIHVLSSSFGEAFPNVLAEAMACGTPCVATDVGDSSYIIGNTGWIAPPRNPQYLASALLKAYNELTTNPLWPERQRLCRQRVSLNFGVERMVSAYVNVWKTVAA